MFVGDREKVKNSHMYGFWMVRCVWRFRKSDHYIVLFRTLSLFYYYIILIKKYGALSSKRRGLSQAAIFVWLTKRESFCLATVSVFTKQFKLNKLTSMLWKKGKLWGITEGHFSAFEKLTDLLRCYNCCHYSLDRFEWIKQRIKESQQYY